MRTVEFKKIADGFILSRVKEMIFDYKFYRYIGGKLDTEDFHQYINCFVADSIFFEDEVQIASNYSSKDILKYVETKIKELNISSAEKKVKELLNGEEFDGRTLGNKTVKEMKNRIFNNTCQKCGFQDEIVEIHHIEPVEKGGKDSLANISCLCPNCHKKIHKLYKKNGSKGFYRIFIKWLKDEIK